MTYRKTQKWKFIKDFDIFGKEVGLYYKGKEKISTYFGCIATILFFIFFFLCAIYKLEKMIKKANISFHEQIEYFEYPPSIQLTRDIFYGGFALENPITYDPFIDETIYYPKVYFKKAIRNGSNWDFDIKEIELERCSIEKFGEAFKDKIIHNSLNNLYCFKEMNETLEGHFSYDNYSYFYIQFFPCINSTENNNHCKPIEEIDFYLDNTFACFEMEDIELTPSNYSYPVRGRNQDIYFPVGKKLFQEIHIFYQYTIIETDLDILGIDELRRYKTQHFLKFHSQVEMTNLIENNIYDSGEDFCAVTIKLFDEVRRQKRTYTKLINVLGDLGGLLEVSLTLFKFFLSFPSTILYELSIVNNLFEFDIDKKIILIQNKYREQYKKENKIANSEQELNVTKKDNFVQNSNQRKISILHSIFLSSKDKDYDYRINKMMNNNISYDNLIYTGKEKKILTNTKDNRNNIQKKQKGIIIKNNNFLSEDNIINKDLRKRETVNENSINKNSKNIIIKNIKFNKIWIYFCCNFIKRRNNKENALFKEGMQLFIDKMDIINIFRNLTITDETKNESQIIEINDSCKDIINI